MDEIRQKWCDDLEDLLCCPICMVRPKAWISQCIGGHHICLDCKTILAQCPTCSQEWSKARNRVAENLCLKLDEIKLSLVDPDNEINKICTPDKVSVASQTDVTGEAGAAIAAAPVAKKAHDNHLLSYPCKIGSCGVVLFYAPMMQHIEKDHSAQFLQIPLRDEKVLQHDWSFDFVEQMTFDRAFHVVSMGTFFLKLSTDVFGNFTGFLLMLHNGYEAKHFTYQLEISCCSEHKTSVKYTGEMNSCRTPPDVLRDKCLIISRTNIQRMLNHTRKLTCAILLGKKPDDNKPESQSRPPVHTKRYHQHNAQNHPNVPTPGPSNNRPKTANDRNGHRPQAAANQRSRNNRDMSVPSRGRNANMNQNPSISGSIPSLLYPHLL